MTKIERLEKRVIAAATKLWREGIKMDTSPGWCGHWDVALADLEHAVEALDRAKKEAKKR